MHKTRRVRLATELIAPSKGYAADRVEHGTSPGAYHNDAPGYKVLATAFARRVVRRCGHGTR